MLMLGVGEMDTQPEVSRHRFANRGARCHNEEDSLLVVAYKPASKTSKRASRIK